MARARLENPNGLDLAGDIYLPSISPRIRRMITVDDDGRLVAVDPFACGTMPGAQYQCALTGLRDGNDDPAALSADGGILTLNADSNDPFSAVFAYGIAAGAVVAHKAELTADETLDASGYADGTYYAYLDYNVATGAVTLAATDRAPLVGFARPSVGGEHLLLTGRHSASYLDGGLGLYVTDTVDGGYAIASSHHSRYGASYYRYKNRAYSYDHRLWRAFDGEATNPAANALATLFWQAQSSSTWPWIQYVFAAAQRVTRVTLGISHRYAGYFPRTVRVYGSDDGSAWTLVAEKGVAMPVSPRCVAVVDFENAASYLRYKVELGPLSLYYKIITELALYGPAPVVAQSDWFNPRTLVMRDENDAQVARVYVGEFEVASGSIASVVTYEYGLRYESDWTALAGGGEVTFTHNLGVEPGEVQVLIKSDGLGDSARVSLGEFARPVRQITANGSASWGADVVGVTARQFTVRAGTQGIWVDPTDAEASIGSGYVKVMARVVW